MNAELFGGLASDPMSDDETADADRLGIIRFRVGAEEFGAELLHVLEILNVDLETVTPLYRCPDYVVGVMNLRGRIKPVIDLRLFLGLAGAHGRPREATTPAVVLAGVGRDLIGLVDGIEQVEWIRPSDCREVQEMVDENLKRHVASTVRTGARPFSILNVAGILNSSEWDRFRA